MVPGHFRTRLSLKSVPLKSVRKAIKIRNMSHSIPSGLSNPRSYDYYQFRHHPWNIQTHIKENNPLKPNNSQLSDHIIWICSSFSEAPLQVRSHRNNSELLHEKLCYKGNQIPCNNNSNLSNSRMAISVWLKILQSLIT